MTTQNDNWTDLDMVLQDAKEQYGTAGAMAYTVRQAFVELSALRARVAELADAKSVSDMLLKDALDLFNGTYELCDQPNTEEWIWKWRVRYYLHDTDIPVHILPEDMKGGKYDQI
jgi:hypothetical protein